MNSHLGKTRKNLKRPLLQGEMPDNYLWERLFISISVISCCLFGSSAPANSVVELRPNPAGRNGHYNGLDRTYFFVR